MSHRKLARLFGKSSSRESTRRTLGRKQARGSLQLERLEDRTVPSNLLSTTLNSFAVLGGQTVTNTGPTIIGGNLGVSPGTAVTGFPPGIVTAPGTIHSADAVAGQAQADLTSAYNTLAGLPTSLGGDLTGQDLGGLTLRPGIYNFTSSAQLTGTLTLDGQGDPNALFVFKIGSTLTSASNSNVVFLNGAQDDEVYWQVGSSATLFTNSTFAGNILALTDVHLQTGTTLVCGRALARNGEVTLDSNIVSTTCASLPGSISGRKVNDLNGDGVLQPGEPGLPGVTLFLDSNGNGILDPGETSTTSDLNGNYSFTGLLPGRYSVREVLPAGSVQTTPNPAAITLSSGQNQGGVNFGDFRLVSIAGSKFNDLNGNGVRDAGEPGLAGVTVFLDTNNNGILDAGERSTVTDVNGNYTFTNLGPGTYRVREVLPAGSLHTTANPADIVASSGINTGGVLLGNFQLVSIAGIKFNDLNGNGVRDAGEPGLAGITVFLDTNGNGILDAGERSTVTDVNGNYTFTNLGPGTYRVREVVPAGSIQTSTNPADIVASSGINTGGVLLGNFQLVSIAGSKFNDLNGNGVRDAGEPGLAGVTVFLDTNNNGILDAGEANTITDINGNYSFANLGPGTYRVREVVPAGLIQTTVSPAAIVASSGSNSIGVLLGDFRLVSIAGSKFNDLNGDGVRDPGEPGLAGITVFLDTNNNSILDAGEPSTLTDVNGNYSFTNLGPGSYRVREVLPAGSTQTTASPAAIVASSGSNSTGVLIGDFRLLSITGSKFNDLNGNGVRDAGEPGLAGITIFLDTNNNGILDAGEPSTLTDVNGNYTFADLGPGTYRVREVPPAGSTQTTANPADILASSGTNISGVLIGNVANATTILAGSSANNSPVSTFPLTTTPLTEFALSSKDLLLGSTAVANANGMLLAQANFVRGLYQNVLGRTPDAAGLIGWVQMLQDGFTRANLADSFWQSAEHRGLQVNQFYTEFLGRAPDSAGRAAWANALLRGASESDIMAGIMSSPEYTASHAGNPAFVTGLYGHVLNRAPSAADQAPWLQALVNGMSRAAVGQMFLTSAEASRRVVDGFYANFLGRTADLASEQFLGPQLQNGTASFESMAVAFLSSDEYLAHVNAG